MDSTNSANFTSASFSAINTKAQSLVIYSTADTTWNVMTFTILNNTGVDLSLTGGTPVNVAQSGAASSFVFDFRSILTDAQAKVMNVKDALGQWGALYFPPTAHTNPTWAVAPLKDLTFKSGDKVVFTLDNIACTSQTPSYFDVLYFNIPGVNDRTFPFSYLVAVLNPPVGKDLKQVVDMGVLNGSVVHVIGTQSPPPPGTSGIPIAVDITYDNAAPIQNGFTLYLKNNTDSPLVPPGTPSGSAVLTISFTFANDDDDAITTQTLGDTIVIGINTEKSKWSTTKHQQDTANWVFTPDPSNQPLMAAHETIQFPISNLITDLNVNPNTLSALHIQWNFIPGYADGYYSVEMQKQEANPGIPSYTIVPTTIDLGQNVQISYQTEVAAYITLEYGLRDGSLVTLKSPDDITYNESNFSPPTAPDKETTLFTLSVYCGPGQPVAQQRPFTITVNQPPAVIDSFTASSMLVDITQAGNQFVLSWQVENAKTILLVGIGEQTETSYPVKDFQKTTTYTLRVTPWGSNGHVVEKTVTVYAYKSFPSVLVGPIGDGTAFQALPLSISNRARGMIYVSNSAAGMVYQISQANHQVLPTQFSGIIMALSADEQKLFVAEWTGSPTNKVRMYDTTSQSEVKSLDEPGPPPYSLAINPAGTQLYYLWRNLLTSVSPFTVNEGANTFTYAPPDITVGTSPQAYAFDATGANLYIGNYKSGNVSVVRLSDNTVTATIGLGDGSEPCSFALVGTTLFVAGSGGNQVYVIDTTTNTTKAPITAGDQPFSLTLDQNKARLFVTNFQASSVTVIDTATLAVTATLPVGNGPSAIKITDSGNLMFVSNYCDKSLTVVDISGGGATVVGTIPLGSGNGNPVDVSTFPTINNYTDVFVAKEYFNGRNNSCPTSSVTDTNLNLSIFSVQEKPSGFKAKAGVGETPGSWQRFVEEFLRLLGLKQD